MRKTDKIKNLKNANMLIEQRYLASKGLINENVNESDLLTEARLKLLPEEMELLNKLVPKYVEIFRDKNLNDFKNGQNVHLGEFNYKLANGDDAVVNFWATYYSSENTKGWFQSNDKKNLKDQIIALNPNYFSPAFSPILFKVFKAITGKDGTEEVRETLYHEMIHAKDPARNNHFLNEPYDSTKAELYYGTWAEFVTMTGQFMEAIINKVNGNINELLNDKTLTKEKYDKEITNMGNVLQNILDFYSGQRALRDETKYFIEGTKGNAIQNFMRKVSQFAEELFGMDLIPYQLNHFTSSLAMIKRYNPEGWKEFHKDLYLTIQECVDKINDATPQVYFAITKKTTPMIADGEYLTRDEYEQVLPRYQEKIKNKTIELLKTAPVIRAGGTGSFKKMEDITNINYSK